MARIIGFEAKVRINGTLFGVRSGEVNVTCDEHEVGDTQSGIYKRHQRGRKTFEATIEAYCDDTVAAGDPASFNLQEGQIINLKVYPKGLAFTPYAAPAFVVFRAGTRIDVGQPVVLTFSGKADDNFIEPTD